MAISIFDIDNWREIGATLSRNKTRTFLTAFGIFWGTAMLALLWGGSHGLRNVMMSNFDGFASNSIMVNSWRTSIPYKGYRKGMSWSMNTKDVENIKAGVEGVDVVSPMSGNSTTYSYGTQSKTGQVMGVEPGYQVAMAPIIESGRFINESDIAERRKVAVIGSNVGSELYLGENPIGKFIAIDNIEYRVVGIVSSKNSNMNFNGTQTEDAVLIPLSTFRLAYNVGDEIDMMMIVFKDGYTPADAFDDIRRIFSMNHPISPEDDVAVSIWDMSEMFETVESVFSGINILLLFVGFSSLLAGIIGVGNIMWIVVKERTKEFGIRRALGATPVQILWQILSESAVLTVIAGLAGICFAVVILAIVSDIPFNGAPSNFQLYFSEAIIVLILFVILGGAAGSIPAFKAMRIKPVEAMNDK